MVETTRVAPSAGPRHDAILEAVAFAAEHLLLTPDWHDAADEVLARLGAATGVSRACVIENHFDDDERLLGTLRAEWCAPGIPPQTGNPSLTAAPWDELPRWRTAHAAGEPVIASVADLPAEERAEFEQQLIRSIAEFPIFTQGRWWGAIGFDDCEAERDWSEAELQALRAAAALLGAALTRQVVEEQRRRAEARWGQVVDLIPAVTYSDELDPDNVVRMGFVSPQIEQVVGYPPERFLADPSFWFTLIHPEDAARLEAAGAFSTEDLQPFEEEYRMRHADGSYRWVHDTSTTVLRDDGTLDHFLGFMTDITERKAAEEQLRHAEERFRALVERIPAIVYAEPLRYDPAFLYLSPQIETILGHSAQDWTSEEGFWWKHMHPDDVDRVRAANERANATFEPFHGEYRLRHRDGHWVWIQDEATVIRGEDGTPLFWQGVLVDITSQKHAELSLREAEERHRTLIEHIPAVVYRESPDADPEQFYISPQITDLFGYTAEEWTWTPDFWRDRIHPDDREFVLRTDGASNLSHESYKLDYRFLHRNGTWIWVRDEATFVADSSGDGYWQGFLLDITQRKETEEQLREAELKFRTIVEQNQAIFYTQEIDPDDPSVSRTTYIAPGNTEMIGYSIDEVHADPTLWRKIVHPDDRHRVFSEDAESNTSGDDRFSLEYRMIAKDGSIVWVQDEAVMVRLPGKAPYWQGFLLDVTERKEAETRLERALDVEREASQRLRALDEMKNTFLQAVSHDLRTPLAAILGLAITLESGDVELDEEDARDLARRIAGNARRLDRLVTNLLDMDRLARGIVSPKLEEVDLAALVQRVLEETQLVDDARVKTDLRTTVQPVDVAKVERIVENLLANTARHTPTNASIWVRVQPEKGGALIAIEDDGPGVPADLRDTIFEPFRQGPDAPQHSPGVGVGLTLVRRFAELHGGSAWVLDREGGGASFRVFLPAKVPTGEDPVPPV